MSSLASWPTVLNPWDPINNKKKKNLSNKLVLMVLTVTRNQQRTNEMPRTFQSDGHKCVDSVSATRDPRSWQSDGEKGVTLALKHPCLDEIDESRTQFVGSHSRISDSKRTYYFYTSC